MNKPLKLEIIMEKELFQKKIKINKQMMKDKMTKEKILF
jgi:hypothetical protein